MSRQLKQAQCVPERGRIHHNVVMLTALQQLLDGQQPGHLGHSRQCRIQQGSDLFLAEKRAALNNFEDTFAVL